MSDFETRNLAVAICSHVYDESEDILYVCKEEGRWQFICGGDHDGEVPKFCGVGHLIDRDQSILELGDLPDNWEAERENSSSPWIRREIVD